MTSDELADAISNNNRGRMVAEAAALAAGDKDAFHMAGVNAAKANDAAHAAWSNRMKSFRRPLR